MRQAKFGDYDRGTLYQLLLDAYSTDKKMVITYKSDWEKFDSFVYDNLEFMEAAGFITEEDSRPIGFISWDSRKLPHIVELGHNCIINDYKGRGIGKEQLENSLKIIRELAPSKIIVKTGDSPFFEPARRMYQSAGFQPKRKIHLLGGVVPEATEYELLL